MQSYIHDIDFDKETFLKGNEYEHCNFHNCDFSDADLKGKSFSKCVFYNCNLSMAQIAGTGFQEVKFVDCKMLGLKFENVNSFGLDFDFDGCQLDHSSFFGIKIKQTVFRNSRLIAVDFTEVDLSGGIFDTCNLDQAIFQNSILVKSDFRTATNYTIDPERNSMKNAKFSLAGVEGLLRKYRIEIS